MELTSSYLLLHLSLIDDVGPATVEKLVQVTPVHELVQLYAASVSDLRHRYQLSAGIAQKIEEGLQNIRLLEQELTLLEQNPAIKWVSWFDVHYPVSLRTTYLPPIVLYYKGDLGNPDNALAIVGSRQATRYGKEAIDAVLPRLVSERWTIVSGGARGIDTMAHVATLEQKGTTIAVLGSGLLRPYPVENKKLFAQIEQEGGAVISSFPLTMQGLPGNFPARNRIIAGLSRGCLVVQAGLQSGARITAEYALQQGKEVFAVPGLMHDPLSAGCHALIQQGAKLIMGAEDILVEYGYQPQQMVAAKCYTSQPLLDPLDQVIVTACSMPSAVDDLIATTTLPLEQLNTRLFDLQLRGIITQTMAGLWQQR